MARIFSTDYLQSGTQTYAPLTGLATRLGALDVDGAVNLINTNLALFTATAFLREVKITCCNRTADLIGIRVAHIDGAIGSIANEDYIFYNVQLLPYETKVINVDGMVSTDTILVRSDSVDVTFKADGQTMDDDYGYRRLGATTVSADTDTALYTTIAPVENITVVACNKDADNSSYIRIAGIDGVIGDWADEDNIIYEDTLLPSESKTYNLEIDLPVSQTIGVRSTDAETNFICYGRFQ